MRNFENVQTDEELHFDITQVDYEEFTFYQVANIGQLVRVRPCGDNKTYLGVYLGNAPAENFISYEKEEKKLTVNVINNPAIFIPELKRVVYGYESWWSKIDSKDQLKDITDEEISNVWYVKAMTDMLEDKQD